MNKELLYEEHKKLVLERFKTLNPDSKIMLGSNGEVISVKDLISHIENNDEFGKKIVTVQISMIKLLTKKGE